jgi:hypothetical protein
MLQPCAINPLAAEDTTMLVAVTNFAYFTTRCQHVSINESEGNLEVFLAEK